MLLCYSRGDWWVVIYTACKSLAKWWGLFLGTSHFDLEGGQKYPPVGICGGAHCPLELQISFKKIAFLSILDGFERSIHPWIGNDVYHFTKIAAILNFHVNMPPSWILCVFGPFLTKTFRCITAQSMLYILMPHSLRKKPYIKRNCSVYRLYNFYSIQNMLFGLSL